MGVIPTRMMPMGVRRMPRIPHIYIPAAQLFNLSVALRTGEEAAGLIGNNINITSYSFDACVRMEGNAPSSNDYQYTLFGPKGISTWQKYFGIFGRYATWFKNPDQGLNISSYLYDGNWHTIHISSGAIVIDGVSRSLSGGSWTTSGVWERLMIGAATSSTSPVSVRSFSCHDGSNNLVFSLDPAKDTSGNGAFLDSVSGTLCKAYNQSAQMPVYAME